MTYSDFNSNIWKNITIAFLNYTLPKVKDYLDKNEQITGLTK